VTPDAAPNVCLCWKCRVFTTPDDPKNICSRSVIFLRVFCCLFLNLLLIVETSFTEFIDVLTRHRFDGGVVPIRHGDLSGINGFRSRLGKTSPPLSHPTPSFIRDSFSPTVCSARAAASSTGSGDGRGSPTELRFAAAKESHIPWSGSSYPGVAQCQSGASGALSSISPSSFSSRHRSSGMVSAKSRIFLSTWAAERTPGITEATAG
jgi:hypothetical protein